MPSPRTTLPPGAAPPPQRDVELVGSDDIAARDPLMGSEKPLRPPFQGRTETGYGSTGSFEKYNGNAGYGSRDALHDAPSSSRRRSVVGPYAQTRSRNKRYIWIGLFALLIVLIAVAVPVGIVVSRNSANEAANGRNANQRDAGQAGPAVTDAPAGSSDAAAPSASATPTWTIAPGPMTGGNGSTVFANNGTASWTYINNFGGHWAAMPFDNSAQAQDDVPPLNQSWDFTRDTIRGVNLGGWLMLEPFIDPDLFERFLDSSPQPVDEYMLMQALDGVSATEKQNVMTEHYENFITEQDFADIASAGLNWIRLPIPFWAIEIYEGEPYAEGVWSYFLKAIEWARKYGIRIKLDMHALPGSQNGWDHSGRRTFSLGMMRGPMGIANAQRSLNYIRTFTEFISQPQYANVIPMIGIVNEIQVQEANEGMGVESARAFYGQAYEVIRNITGTGEGPYIAIHDGFNGLQTWEGFLSGADRVVLDSHPYLAFGPQNTDPLLEQQRRACDYGSGMRQSMRNFGITTGGEWSLAINDCSFLLNGVGLGIRYEGTYPSAGSATSEAVGSCDEWNDAENWSTERRRQFRDLTLAWMDSLQHFFFWTWKIRNRLDGSSPNPFWHYQGGLRNNYVPTDPRSAPGSCQRLVDSGDSPITSPVVRPTSTSVSRPAWPPQNVIEGVSSNTYTPTGSIIVLPVATPTAFPSDASPEAVSSVLANLGSGWSNEGQRAVPFYVPISGRSYPPQWNGEGVSSSEGLLDPTMRLAFTGGAAPVATSASAAVTTPTSIAAPVASSAPAPVATR